MNEKEKKLFQLLKVRLNKTISTANTIKERCSDNIREIDRLLNDE